MTQRERDRLVAKADLITQKQAAQQTGLSERHLRRLLAKRSEGDQAVVSSPNPSTPALARLWRRSISSSATASSAAKRCGEDGRRGPVEAPPKSGRPHPWRPRRSCRGELVQWDTSDTGWRDAGEKLFDRHDRRRQQRVAGALRPARLGRRESPFAEDVSEQNGRPVAFYTDRASLFVNTPKNSAGEDPKLLPPTDRGAGHRIDHDSPQAKGRVERSFGTAQDRLCGWPGPRRSNRPTPTWKASFCPGGTPRCGCSRLTPTRRMRARSRARSGLGEPGRDAAGRQRLHDSLPGKELSNRPQGDCAGSAKPSAGGETPGRRTARCAEEPQSERPQPKSAQAEPAAAAAEKAGGKAAGKRSSDWISI